MSGKKVEEFHSWSGVSPEAILFDKCLSVLDVLDTSMANVLKARADYRDNFRRIGREPPEGDYDGAETRALVIRKMLAEAREHIRLGKAEEAANVAARAAYLVSELDVTHADESALAMMRESIRLAAQKEDD